MGQNTQWVDLTQQLGKMVLTQIVGLIICENIYIAGLSLTQILGYSMSHFNHCFYKKILLLLLLSDI